MRKGELEIKHYDDLGSSLFDGVDNFDGVDLSMTEAKYHQLVAKKLGVKSFTAYYAGEKYGSIQYKADDALAGDEDSRVSSEDIHYACEDVWNEGKFWVMKK